VIIDRVENVHRYSALGGRIGRALQYLRDTNLATLEPGRLELEGRRLYVLVSDYLTKRQDEGRWEAHQRYIDLQTVVAGAERIGYVPAARLEAGPHDEEKDMTWLSGSGPFLPLLPGDFVLLWPGEAHMPGIALEEPAPVRKVVIKIAVDDHA
jgi:YhcH/YjgK/YiaL family protein